MIAGGGTGGHLFPALAVADELRSRHPDARITFVGSRRGLERSLVPSAGYPLWSLRLGGIKGKSLLGRLNSAVAAGWAVLRCAAWMARRRPDLEIGVGGYASGPATLAAQKLGVPTMVLEQNHFPGATNRWLASRVDAVCVPSEAAASRLTGNCIVTGNPVRREFTEIGDPPSRPELSLLVFGGSRGARSINRAMIDAVAELGRIDPPPRIVHQTGKEDESEVAAACASYPGDYEVRAFLEDMPARFSAADVVICRSGATTVAELAAAGRPAVLVPFPHATDDHQTHNARALEESGAAVLVPDRELDGARLVAEVRTLTSQRDRLRDMGRAARRTARLDATEQIADVADALLARKTPGRGAEHAERRSPRVS